MTVTSMDGARFGDLDGGSRAAARGATLLVVSIALSLIPATAHADGGPAFDIASAPPLLDGGATLGPIDTGVEQTAGYRGSGPCPVDGDPDGYAHAAVFRIDVPSRSLLTVDVRDDLDGSPSLCRVTVYRDGGGAFTDPFDSEQRAAHKLKATNACADASSCRLEAWTGGGKTYYLALFSAAPRGSEPDDASFSITGSLRRSIALRLSFSGHRIKERCSGYHEVIRGRRFRLAARTLPTAGGVVRFRWYRRTSSGSWRLVSTYRRETSAGVARVSKLAGDGGKWLLDATFLANQKSLSSTTKRVRVRFVAPRWRRYSDGGYRLSVRYYRQQHRLSCEAASLRTAHNYHNAGSIDYDMQVYRVTGIDKRRPAVRGGCNPNRAFCGRVNGYMMRDGYGVHAGPIARAATRFDRCRPGLLLRDYSVSTIATHIRNGYPVVVWGAHRGATGIYRYSWRAWDGSWVVAWSVEHTWTVIGFRGSASNPTHLIVHDPSRGASLLVPKWRFRAFTKYFETAVVVRG